MEGQHRYAGAETACCAGSGGKYPAVRSRSSAHVVAPFFRSGACASFGWPAYVKRRPVYRHHRRPGLFPVVHRRSQRVWRPGVQAVAADCFRELA